MEKTHLLPLSIAALFSSSVFATSTQVYVEQNFASNAADDGVYTTEAGANITTSEQSHVYIGFDDQGWLAAGYGYQFNLTESLNFNLYGELGKWETGEEILIEGVFDLQVTDHVSLFTGYGYNRSGQVIENLSDTVINTNQFIAGTSFDWGRYVLSYTYTHENRGGTNGGFEHSDAIGVFFSQDSYRTNEHEVILSAQFDDWTPYLKYTHFNTNKGVLYRNDAPIQGKIDDDNIWTLGLSYQF